MLPLLPSFPSPPLLPKILDKASLAFLETFGFSGVGFGGSFLGTTGVGVFLMSFFKGFPQFKPAQFQQFAFKLAELTPGTVYFDNLYFSLTDPALGTQNFETSKVSLYPNPVKNTLNIEAKGSIERVAVYSILGQEVMSKSPKSNATTLQTSGLQKGTYIVKSTIDGKTATSKFIKE